VVVWPAAQVDELLDRARAKARADAERLARLRR
jgi:hypothetical protein